MGKSVQRASELNIQTPKGLNDSVLSACNIIIVGDKLCFDLTLVSLQVESRPVERLERYVARVKAGFH